MSLCVNNFNFPTTAASFAFAFSLPFPFAVAVAFEKRRQARKWSGPTTQTWGTQTGGKLW